MTGNGMAVAITDTSPVALESSFYAVEETYIKLFRGVINSWVWERGDHLKIWLYLLLKANYADRKMVAGKGTVKVNRGQLLRSLSTIADDCKLSVQNVRTFLDIAEADGALTREVTQYGTLITICNYSGYQGGDSEGNTPSNTRPTQGQHAPNTRSTRAQHAPNNVIRREEGKNGRRKEDNTPLPPVGGVLDYPEFHKAWESWQRHRREIRKPLTPTSAQSQLDKLTKEAEQGNDPVAIISNSLAGSYQGLFPPKQGEMKPNIPDPDELEKFVRTKYPNRDDGTNPEARYGLEFYRKYSAQGWYLANKMPIINWRAAVVQWIEKAMRENQP